MTKQLATPQFSKARDAIMIDYSKGVAEIQKRWNSMAELARAWHN